MPNIIGATFALVLSLTSAVAHLAAFRDPDRNFGTQLIDAWYSHWWEPAERRHGVLGFMAAGSFILTIFFAGILLHEILRID